MKDYKEEKNDFDSELSIDDILAEFREEKSTSLELDSSVISDTVSEVSTLLKENPEILPEPETTVTPPEKEFKLNRELIDTKVKSFIKPKEQERELATKETLNKNKLDAFFETFYGEKAGSSPEEEPLIEKIEDREEPTEFLETEDEIPQNVETETAIEAEKEPFTEPPLPERFFKKEEYISEFPIKAPPSTDTKLREEPAMEDSGEFYETTDQITGKKSLFARLMSRLLTESEDNEEPVETGRAPVIEIDEFESPEDKDSVLADLCLQKKEAFFKTSVSGVLCLLLLYLNAGSLNEGLLPSFLRPSAGLFGFSTASALLFLVLAATGLNTFLSGLKGVLTFKGTNETLPSFALLCSLIFSVYGAFSGVPEGVSFCFFGGAAGLSFFFCLLGKYLHITAVGSNIGFLVNDREKSTLVRMTKSELPAEIDTEGNEIAGIVKGGFFTGFFDKSFGDDPSYQYSKRTSTLFILLTIGFAGFAFFKGGSFFALTAVAGMSALGASFLSGLSFSVPFLRWLTPLKKRGAMIAGYSTALSFGGTNALVIQDSELFPPKSTEVTGMKMFGKNEIYDVAYTMASLYGAVGGPLKYAFSKLIDHKKQLLKPVTDLRFFEGKGISGSMDGQKILAGSAAYLAENNVLMPPDNYEEKLGSKGKQVVFFAGDGELKGMFTLSFSPDTDRVEELSHFDYDNNALLVYSDDHNITPELIRQKFSLHHLEVLVYGSQSGEKMKPALEKKERLPAGIISLTGLGGIIFAITAARRLKKSVRLCLVMRAVSTVLAFGLGGFLIYNGTVMEPMQVLGYQGIWGILALILTLLGL